MTIKVAGDAKPAYFGVYQLIEPVYDYKSKKSNLENAKTQLSDFINNINNKQGADFKNYLDSKMDVKLFLKTYAVNVILGMWDDYWNNKNNYYSYLDPAGKFYFIPYDYDNVLGTSLLMNDSGKQDPLNWGDGNAQPFVSKIISMPEYKTMYLQYLKDLADKKYDLFYVMQSQKRIINWQSKISPYISNDTGEDMSMYDAPASWGNQPNYKVLSGETNNFFITKANSLPK